MKGGGKFEKNQDRSGGGLIIYLIARAAKQRALNSTLKEGIYVRTFLLEGFESERKQGGKKKEQAETLYTEKGASQKQAGELNEWSSSSGRDRMER